MHYLDFIFIFMFILLIFITGVVFAKVGGKDMKSFFAAGGTVPWQINGLSLFMGFFSAGTFVVWGSIAYSLGWVSVTIQWSMALAGFAVGAFIAPMWHKVGTLTVAEYISTRLGIRTKNIFTFLFLLVSLFTTGSFLYPVARIVEVSTGLPLNACILLLGGICVLYVSIGGLWAVVVTDVLQFIVLTAAVLIVLPLAFDRVGNISTFISSAPDTFFNLLNGEYTIGFVIAFSIYNMIFLGGNWAYVQRYTSVGSSNDAKKVGFLFGTLYIFSPVLWMLPPMIYRVVNSGLSGLNSEGAYLLMCKEVLPHGLLGMILGGMIFATASSLNSTLNISSGVFTNDIFKRLCPTCSNRILMRVARLSTVIFGILAIIVALLIPLMGGIVNVVISVAALTGVPLYLPMIWTLFSKRQTGKSVVITTLLSLCVNSFFKFITPFLFGFSLNRADEMILGVTFPALCLAAFELYYKVTGKTSKGYLSYIKSEDLSDSELYASESRANNKFAIKVLSVGIIITGSMIMILGIMAEYAKTIVLIVGVLLMLLGFFIKSKSKD